MSTEHARNRVAYMRRYPTFVQVGVMIPSGLPEL